jgi:hypothetical protein
MENFDESKMDRRNAHRVKNRDHLYIARRQVNPATRKLADGNFQVQEQVDSAKNILLHDIYQM